MSVVIETTNATNRSRRKSKSGWFLVLAMAGFGLSSVIYKSPVPDAAWGGDLSVAQARADQLGKPVLVQFTTDGCMYCVRMERNVLPVPEVKAAVSDFEAVRIRWPQEGEIVERYGVEVFPTFLVINPDGTPIKGITGYVPQQEFIQFLQRAAASFSHDVSAASTAGDVQPSGP